MIPNARGLVGLGAFVAHLSLVSGVMRFPLPGWESGSITVPPCPCSSPGLCKPLETHHKRETFGFYEKLRHPGPKYMDWHDLPLEHITTVAWAPNSTEFMCKAHAQGTRLVAPTWGVPLTGSPAEKKAWIQGVVQSVKATFFDGVNFDYESPMSHDSPLRESYVGIIRDTRAALREALGNGVQVSVDVAWNPNNIDKRSYPVVEFAKASDYLYVMDYDTRSQIFGRCVAGPNSPIWGGVSGLELYIDLGIPKEKLIWGTPWYGYVYPCLPGTSAEGVDCPTRLVPFRGVNCSDASGHEVEYANIEEMRYKYGQPMQYDNYTESAWFKYTEGGVVNQVWYDSVRSVQAKINQAASMELGGWGPFTWTDLDPHGRTSNPQARQEAKEFWAAVGDYARGD